MQWIQWFATGPVRLETPHADSDAYDVFESKRASAAALIRWGLTWASLRNHSSVSTPPHLCAIGNSIRFVVQIRARSKAAAICV